MDIIKNRIKLYLFGLFFIASCVENSDIGLQINGIVLQFNSKLSVNGQKIILELGDEFDFSNNLTLTNLKLDSTITDKNGQYRFQYKEQPRKQYRIKVPQGYIIANEPPVGGSSIIDNRSVITDTIYIGKAASIRLTFRNNNLLDGDKLIGINWNYQNPFIQFPIEIVQSSSLAVNGYFPDNFTITREYLSEINKSLTIKYKVDRGGLITEYQDIVYLIEQELVEQIIEY